MRYLIADLHAGDKNIIEYYHRPFKNVDSMNNTLIANWNSTVDNDDEVIIAGDIGDPKILYELKGRKIIVCGNHDDYDKLHSMFPEIEISKHPILIDYMWISHEPLTYLPKECPYLNVHGHLHSLIYGQEDRTWDGGCRYFNVSVEKIGYTPISEIQIKEMLTKGITSI